MTVWGYRKAALWVNPGKGTLSVGVGKAMSAVIGDKKLKMEYGPEWEEFLYSDERHPDRKDLGQTIRDKLDKTPSGLSWMPRSGRGRGAWEEAAFELGGVARIVW